MEKKISVGTIVAILLIISAGLLVYLTLERGKEHKEIIKKIDNIQEVQVETIKLLSDDLVFIDKRLRSIEKKIDNLAKKPKVITRTIKAPVEKKAEEPKKVEEKTTSSVESSSTSTTTNTKNVTNVQNVRNEARRNHYSKDRRSVESDGDCDCEEEEDEEEEEEECDC